MPGLLVAGEAVGGANGANRLSGNAVTEALVFGRRAGRSAARRVRGLRAQPFRPRAAAAALDLIVPTARRAGGAAQPRGDDPRAAGGDGGRCRRAPHRRQARTRHRPDRRSRPRPRRAPVRLTAGRSTCAASTGSTCATCCWLPASWPRPPCAAPKAAAPISARIFPAWLAEWQVNQVVRWRDGDLDLPRCGRQSRRAWQRRRRQQRRRQQRQRNDRDRATEGVARDRAAGRSFRPYEVPFEPGQSVLDGLCWISANRDPSLAFRFSCINANACKECMMEIDGATRLCLHRAPAGRAR